VTWFAGWRCTPAAGAEVGVLRDERAPSTGPGAKLPRQSIVEK
jgi:hypothetical protein